MSVDRFEVGIVSGSRAVVDFLADVFELDERPATVYPAGTLYRLRSPGAVIKVMVPSEPPTGADGQPFFAVKGLRYLTMFVTDLDRVLERCVARAGRVLVEPFEFEPGARLAIISDPDGNTMEIAETT